MNEEEIKALQERAAKAEEMAKTLEKLQASVEALEAKNREILSEKAAAKKAAEEAAAEAARKSGDVEAIEKSWQEKLQSEIEAREARIGEYEQMVNRMTVGSEASKLAAELALPGSAEALLPHIERRLAVEIKDGKPAIRVLGADGKPTANGIEDLRKEITENKAFAPLLVGSNASGSGNVGGKGNTGGKVITREAFDAMPQADRAAFFKDGGKLADA